MRPQGPRHGSWQGAAVLIDLDGTLVDSGPSVVRAWRWLAEQTSRPFELFEPYIHGVPADQVLAELLPDLPASERAAYAAELLARQAEDTFDVVPVAGAASLLDGLAMNRWAIVTSGDHRLATSRIAAAGLPRARVLITADDVAIGKPDPAPYLLAAARLSADPAACLVLEDAPAGVAAGRAAGMPVLGVLTSMSTWQGPVKWSRVCESRLVFIGVCRLQRIGLVPDSPGMSAGDGGCTRSSSH
ncbi:MAG: HAD-superfamily hydrolase, subfamily variant 3 [Frankiales bacterium]|nr:HAD-superfamily hydrolase, subfamily variant 3 [Frankiales bacterium]